MNNRSQLPSEDDMRFDRLVDGELSGDEYSRLLASLDDQPEGWRRCALAFLEAQALGQEFSATRRELDLPASPKSSQTPWKAPVPRGLWLALATTFLVALGLGFMLRGVTLHPGAMLATQPTGISTPRPESGNKIAANSISRRSPLGSLSLVVNSDGGSRDEQISLPVFDSGNAESLLSMENSVLPPDVLRTLERLGHRVEQRRELMPFELQDGRQVIVPVEQYRIDPAVRRTY